MSGARQLCPVCKSPLRPCQCDREDGYVSPPGAVRNSRLGTRSRLTSSSGLSSSPLRSVNSERRRRRYARNFSDKADWIREQPCDVCGRRPSDPHHHPTVGAGGTKRDLMPLCRDHHTLGPDAYHRLGAVTFAKRHDLDLAARTALWERRWQEQAA